MLTHMLFMGKKRHDGKIRNSGEKNGTELIENRFTQKIHPLDFNLSTNLIENSNALTNY